MKKHMTIFAVILTVGISMAQEGEPAKEPAELIKLRTEYQEQIRKAQAPITEAYVTSLTALVKKLGADGKLKEGLAVQAEIDAIKAAIATPKSATKKEIIPVYIGTWKSSGGSNITINKDNTMLFMGNTLDYKVKDEKTLTVDMSGNAGVHTFRFSEDKGSFTRERDKTKWTLTRVRE